VNRKEILEIAEELISGVRHQSYGEATESFNRVARLWNAYLYNQFREGRLISAGDVGIMMALLKIARMQTDPSLMDNYVDACGYLALTGEINGG